MLSNASLLWLESFLCLESRCLHSTRYVADLKPIFETIGVLVSGNVVRGNFFNWPCV